MMLISTKYSFRSPNNWGPPIQALEHQIEWRVSSAGWKIGVTIQTEQHQMELRCSHPMLRSREQEVQSMEWNRGLPMMTQGIGVCLSQQRSVDSVRIDCRNELEECQSRQTCTNGDWGASIAAELYRRGLSNGPLLYDWWVQWLPE
jgi:hypothetical protein